MKKVFLIIASLIIVVLLVAFFLNGAPRAIDPAIKTQSTGSKYSFEELTKHKDAASCWTAINNKIYDLTTYITKHKGGASKILMICGKDGSYVFEKQHLGDPKVMRDLEQLYLGDLK